MSDGVRIPMILDFSMNQSRDCQAPSSLFYRKDLPMTGTVRVFVFLLTILLLRGESLFAQNDVRILTFNILLSKADRYIPAEKCWANRQKGMSEVIQSGKYDFIGLQEVIYCDDPKVSQDKFLRTAFPDYGMLGRAREANPDDGEGTPIMYRKNRWMPDPVEQGVFWLSDTPKISSITWTAHHPRTVVWARFLELNDGKKTGRALYFLNTHYSYAAEETKIKSSILIADFIAKRQHKNDPVLLTADFNSSENAPSMKYLKGETVLLNEKKCLPVLHLTDLFRKVNPDANEKDKTIHVYKTNPLEWGRIDFIYGSENVIPLSARVIQKADKNGLFPSDHFPVEAVIKW